MILAIDASSSLGEIALVAAGEVRSSATFPTGPQHGGEMFSALQSVWQSAAELSEIRVGLGPGSYAGVRMAIAAVTGLALARSVPLLGLPSVCALAPAGRYCAVGDARRGGFYFTSVEEGRVLDGPRIVDRSTLFELLSEHSGWPVYAADEALRQAVEGAQLSQPSARLLAGLPVEAPARPLEPIYLRDPHITKAKPTAPPPGSPTKNPR